MIQIQQLHIPGYIPLRKQRVENVRRDGLRLLSDTNLITTETLSFEMERFFLQLIEGLCDLLIDDLQSTCHAFEIGFLHLVESCDNAEGISLVEMSILLGVFQDHFASDAGESLRRHASNAVEERVTAILDHLILHYDTLLSEDLHRLNEFNSYYQRENLRREICNQLDDGLSARPQVNADEAAMWILTNTVGAQADVALALLKDGQNLVDAVAAAKTFQP